MTKSESTEFRGGREDGRGARNEGKAALAHYLTGMSWPATKQQISDQLKCNGAPSGVSAILVSQLSDGATYNNADDVFNAHEQAELKDVRAPGRSR